MFRERTRNPRTALDSDHIWLTFDDGPTTDLTPSILDILAHYRVSATFFVCGVAALQNPDLIRRAVNEGHNVANHTMTHPDLTKIEISEIETEIAHTNEIIERLVGARPRWFRPPYGRYDDRVLDAAEGLGLETVLWSVSAEDWSCPGVSALVDITVAQTQAGAIVLFHDGCGHLPGDAPVPPAMREQVITALPQILEALQSRVFFAPGEENA